MFINRGMDKEDVVQTHSGMSVGLTKMNEVIMHVAATWMELEIVKLSNIGQRKPNSILYCLYVESEKGYK